MAAVTIADTWTPTIWFAAIREALEKYPSVINSGIALRTPGLESVASGAGVSANIPMWHDISDTGGEEIQVEGTAPVTTRGITAGTQVCTILNRVAKFGANALAAAVSGGDPVGEIAAQLAIDRLKRRQTTLISILRGQFGTLTQTPDQAQGVLRASRRDNFIEDGAAATADQLIDAEKVIYTIGLLGERRDTLSSGAMLIHSTILSALEVLDKDSFKDGVESGLPFTVRTYRGIPIFVCDSLVRAGATSGYVYETYILAKGLVGMGEKPQVFDDGETIEVASLQRRADKDTNQMLIWDRTRFVMHINGVKWTGTPSGQSATDAELATHSNWSLVSTAKRVGGVVLRTNG